MTDGVLVDSGIPTQTATQDKNEAEAIAAYAWDTVTHGALSLSLGLRQEWVQYHSENYNAPFDKHENRVLASMPAAGLFYRITPRFAYLLGVYKGMGLSAEDSTNAGKPEESVNYETGFRWTDGLANANLIGFFNDYKNIQGSCTTAEGCSSSATDQVFNGGRAKIYGVEANLLDQYRVAPKLTIPLNLAYTYTRAYFGGDFNSHLTDWGIGLVHKGDPLPYVPMHQATIGSGFQYGRLAFDALWTIKSKSYDQSIAAGREEVPSSTYLDLALRYFVWKEWQVYATADNVTDEKTIVSYRSMGARPGKPRTYIYGIKGTF